MVSGTKYTGLKTRLKQIKILTLNEYVSLGKQYYIFVRSILYIDRLVHMIWLESHILNCTGRLFKSVDWCISQMVVICWAFLLHNSWYFYESFDSLLGGWKLFSRIFWQINVSNSHAVVVSITAQNLPQIIFVILFFLY